VHLELLIHGHEVHVLLIIGEPRELASLVVTARLAELGARSVAPLRRAVRGREQSIQLGSSEVDDERRLAGPTVRRHPIADIPG
jgi:hypothetical protein